MTGRNYAQINCSLTRSKKLAALQDHKHKWAYLCAHLSDFGNFLGLFRYPMTAWCDDAGLSRDELTGAISEMQSVGLIDYDHDEEIVRIVSWYHKKNCPENASRMIGHIGDYLVCEIENADMLLASVAEFIVGSVQRSRSWKTSSPDLQKMRDAFAEFCRQLYQEYDEQFLSALSWELDLAAKSIRGEVLGFCPILGVFEQEQCPPALDTVPTPCRDTKTKTKTKTNTTLDLERTNTNTKTKTKTASKFSDSDDLSEITENGQVAVLRNGHSMALPAQSIGPREATKRSVLARRAT